MTAMISPTTNSNTPNTRRGLLISFEGIDGCGKTTQTRRLLERFRSVGRNNVTVLRLPGGSPVCESLRTILKDPASKLSPAAELLLFSATHAQLVHEKIKPLLEQGEIVILDRFIDSTIAYQGGGRGHDLERLNQLIELATEGLKPDITFFLDMPAVDAQRRMNWQTSKADTFDQLPQEFFERVRAAYKQLAVMNPGRIRTIDACNHEEAVACCIWQNMSEAQVLPYEEVDGVKMRYQPSPITDGPNLAEVSCRAAVMPAFETDINKTTN